MARRLSSSTARRWPSSAVVKNPPRHKLDTRRPESATMAAASFSPTSATGSRHSPMLAMPASPGHEPLYKAMLRAGQGTTTPPQGKSG
jgi:hypothetical protein